MEGDPELHDEDLVEGQQALTIDLGDHGDHGVAEHEDGDGEPSVSVEAATGWEWRSPPISASHEARLRVLLRDLCSPEVTIHSEASRELVALLRADAGGDILSEYIRVSPRCSELLDAWKLRQGKPGMAHVLSLTAAVLGHPLGKSRAGGIWRNIDNFGRSIVTSKLDDLYVELKSEEGKRQAAALTLLAAVVRRGMSLASEVVRVFDFKLSVLPKLAGVQKKNGGREAKQRKRHSTRRAFVEFAISFLEVGNPRLLRWILQQKEMYSGVLRGIGTDDPETILYVLSALRDKVLCADSLVPPGLRSVLFGSATLEQLSHISANPAAGEAADVAHEVLIMVCTDPRNGLMPEANLRGNVKRLCDLMKKLEATKSAKHRDLLLAIVKGRPFFCSSYMDEFPYHLEPLASRTWYRAISLAADLISSVNTCTSFGFLTTSKSSDPPRLDSAELQQILQCVAPRAFTRSVINKGLLHSDIFVKHGSLRLLLEALRLLDSLNNIIVRLIDKMSSIPSAVSSEETAPGYPRNFHVFESACHEVKKASVNSRSNMNLHKWMSLKEEIQDEVRSLLPDPQVLLKLLTSFMHKGSEALKCPLKRCMNSPNPLQKKLKSDVTSFDEEVDIVLSVVESQHTIHANEDYENGGDVVRTETVSDHKVSMTEIWGPETHKIIKETEDVRNFFHAKLLEVLKFYLRVLPVTLEGSFDFIKILPSNPAVLSINQQESMLALLAEYTGQFPGIRDQNKIPNMMYKSLQPLMSLLIFSPIQSIQKQAFALARTALLSTGAFDFSFSEIDAWFLFLLSYNKVNHSNELHVTGDFRDFSSVVISFFCEAVSTVGNNLYKYLDHTRAFISRLGMSEDYCPDFSPLVICILQKCIRVLESDSRTFKISERCIISLYVYNTISFIMQAQVEMRVLPHLVGLILNEKLRERCSEDGQKCRSSLCEWRPLNDLLLLSQRIYHQQACDPSSRVTGRTSERIFGSFTTVVNTVSEFLEQGGMDGFPAVASAMCFSAICATPDDLLENFPTLLAIAPHIPRAHIQFLSSNLFQSEFLGNVANRWPDMFCYSLDKVALCARNNSKGLDSCRITRGATATSDVESSLPDLLSLILEYASFHASFVAAVNYFDCKLLLSSKMLEMLCAKLDEESIDNCILSLRVVLFWACQIRSGYTRHQTKNQEQRFEFCVNIVDHILDKILVQPYVMETEGIDAPIIPDYFLEVAEIIFHHPFITLSISHPLKCNEGHSKEFTGNNLGEFLELSRQNVHIMDYHSLHILSRMGEFMLKFGSESDPAKRHSDSVSESVQRAFIHLLQRSLSLFKEDFVLYISKKAVDSFSPALSTVCLLAQFIAPFDLMVLAKWMFFKIDEKLDSCASKRACALSACFCVANIALDMLHNLFYHTGVRSSWSLWETKNIMLPDYSLQYVYHKIVDCAILFELDCAASCLMKSVDAIYMRSLMQSFAAFVSSMQLSRIIMSCPMKFMAYCIQRTDKIKAKIIFELIEVSPLHSSLFGMSFLDLIKQFSSADYSNMNVSWPPKLDMNGTTILDISNEDFVLLLPAALSYLTTVYSKCGKYDVKLLRCIPSFYSKIILDGFSNWRNYCTGKLFLEDFDDYKPQTVEQFLDYFSNTLLAKAVHMLHFDCILSGGSMKKKQRLGIFGSVFDNVSLYDQLFDCDIGEIDPLSCKASLNLINRVIAKISLANLLLFPSGILMQSSPMGVDGNPKLPSKKTSNSENCAKARFLVILFNSLHSLVTKIPVNPGQCNDVGCNNMFKFLEIHILRNIVHLCIDIKGHLIQLPSITFLKSFIRSSLLHRFEDPSTLRALRIIICTLEAQSSSLDVLQFVLGHSEFVSTILWNKYNADTHSSIISGALLQPLPSIFKLLNYSPTARPLVATGDSKEAYSCSGSNPQFFQNRKLELIKLLRVLLHLRDKGQIASVESTGVNCRELLSLLLSGYGATLSRVDMEALQLMHEIEIMEGPDHKSIASMDYMWGAAAVKLRQEHRLDQLALQSEIAYEPEDEKRRRLFRENVVLDSRCCLTTVLNFPFDRAKQTDMMSMDNLLCDNAVESSENLSHEMYKIQQYDPVFILPFSIHILLKGYLEPVEFVRLGLLAVALISISSHDEEIRKLGYEVLGLFKLTLENHRKSKEILQLSVLLAYLQNGITDAWQKVPSITAMFAAEAAFIVLDPSHNNFQIISKFLLHSPKADLKAVPLFDSLFTSDSVHFKANRMWILQLLYLGLNSDDDAQIFMKRHMFELLLSFYMSSLSDCETKVLILLIVKKSVKVHMLSNQLVRHHSLLSWLLSIITTNAESLSGDQEDFSMHLMESAVEVLNIVVSLNSITEWLKDDALEQLSEISQFLYILFIGSLKWLKENVSLMISILGLIVSTLNLSQKRKIFQPHFTLSIDALLSLSQAIDCELKGTRFYPVIQQGLTIILMSAPLPVQWLEDKEKLYCLVTWAISIALRSDQMQTGLIDKRYQDFIEFEGQQREENIFSRILRWITASINLGSFPCKYNEIKDTQATTLQFLLRMVMRKDTENEEHSSQRNEDLAAIILHLQHLLRVDYAASPSIVSALCLLLSGSKTWNEERGNLIMSLCGKICCPPEANPSWRWSYYQAWRDLSLDQTDSQKLEEQQTCQVLLLLLSSFLGTNSDFEIQLYQDVENSGLFAWERSLIMED